jgi:amino acid transporter
VPFALFFLLATPRMAPALVFAPARDGAVDVRQLFAALYWQYSGIDTVAALASEAARTRALLRRVFLWTLLAVVAMYVLAGCAAATLTDGASTDFGLLSRALPYCESGWLANWIRLAGFLSSAGTFMVAVALAARELYAGALFGALPLSALFRRVAKTVGGEPAPVWAMLAVAVLAAAFTPLGLEALADWSCILTALQILVQCAAFVAMRLPQRVEVLKRARADCRVEEWGGHEEVPTDRVFVVPGGWVGVGLATAPLVVVSGFFIWNSGWLALVLVIAMLAGGVLLRCLEIGIVAFIGNWRAGNAVVEEPDQDDLLLTARP